MHVKRWLWTVVIGAGIAVAGTMAPAAKADACRDAQKERIYLQRDIDAHGWNSWQSQVRREWLGQLEAQCNGYYQRNRRGNFGWNNGRGRDDGDHDRDDRRWNRDWRRGDGDHDRDDRRSNRGSRSNNGDHDRNNRGHEDRGHDGR